MVGIKRKSKLVLTNGDGLILEIVVLKLMKLIRFLIEIIVNKIVVE